MPRAYAERKKAAPHSHRPLDCEQGLEGMPAGPLQRVEPLVLMQMPGSHHLLQIRQEGRKAARGDPIEAVGALLVCLADRRRWGLEAVGAVGVVGEGERWDGGRGREHKDTAGARPSPPPSLGKCGIHRVKVLWLTCQAWVLPSPQWRVAG